MIPKKSGQENDPFTDYSKERRFSQHLEVQQWGGCGFSGSCEMAVSAGSLPASCFHIICIFGLPPMEMKCDNLPCKTIWFSLR